VKVLQQFLLWAFYGPSTSFFEKIEVVFLEIVKSDFH